MSNQIGGGSAPLNLHFKNKHLGQTCLLLGNGPSIRDVSLGLLDRYPTIASNTFFRSGFIPTYYTAIDQRVWREFLPEIRKKYRNIPILLPDKLDYWKGYNVYHFALKGFSIVMHFQIMLAKYMGFDTILMAGVDHRNFREHFWGVDEEQPGVPDMQRAERIYKELSQDVINITPNSALPEHIIRRGW